MRGTECHVGVGGGGSFSSATAAAAHASVSFVFRARSVLTFRRNQVVSVENAHEEQLRELDLFQSNVAHRLLSLSSSSDNHHRRNQENEQNKREQQQQQEPLLTLPFLQKLLETFVCIEEEFKPLLLGRDPALVSNPPLDRLVSDLLDRLVRSLDVCNVVTHSLDALRHCQRHAEIAAFALDTSPSPSQLGEGQFYRAKRALWRFLVSISPDHHHHRNGGGFCRATTTERAWSFSRGCGGSNGSAGNGNPATRCKHRSLSWSVSRNWSPAKQMQAIWANLTPPRGGDATALAMAVYTMTVVLAFVMWALVAAVDPCQERGGGGGHSAMSFPALPRQLPWAGPMIALQERITEEWRRKDRKGASSPSSTALLAELQSLERWGRVVVEMEGSSLTRFALDEEKREEVAEIGRELAETCGRMEELVPFQRQVREVFHWIARSRAELLDCSRQGNRTTHPPVL